MMLHRDLEHTVTGWRWLDRVVEPYWWVRGRLAERSIERTLGITGTREERRDQWRRLLAGAPGGEER